MIFWFSLDFSFLLEIESSASEFLEIEWISIYSLRNSFVELEFVKRSFASCATLFFFHNSQIFFGVLCTPCMP